MILFKNVDLYEMNGKFLVAQQDKLFLLENQHVRDLKLPLNIKNLQLSVGVDNQLIVWGDDGIGNTFYIGSIEKENSEWERVWLSDTNKKVDSVILDYQNNFFIVLKDKSGLAYEALINKKIYAWAPPRNTPASVSLSPKSNPEASFLLIEQSDNFPVQITKDLKQTCKVNFVIESEFKGVENDIVKFNHIISSVSVESQNFDTVKLTPAQFKTILSGAKALNEIAEVKYKTISYEDFRVERDTPPPQPQNLNQAFASDLNSVDYDLMINDTVGKENTQTAEFSRIIKVNPNFPSLNNKPVFKE